MRVLGRGSVHNEPSAGVGVLSGVDQVVKLGETSRIAEITFCTSAMTGTSWCGCRPQKASSEMSTQRRGWMDDVETHEAFGR